jgi:di/tricarboxylate transporter
MAMLLSAFSVIASSVSDSGGGTLIANFISNLLGNSVNPYLISFVLFAVVAIVTNFLSNTVCVMLMGPIAVYLAQAMNLNPFSLVVVVVLAANASFATPVGAPPYTIIMPIARYKFKDYVRMGLPLVVINLIIAVIIIPLVWKF